MKRYAAFLRGVMPTNCKMADLRAAFELAGFTDVKTVRGSGNVVFTAREATESVLERRAETAMQKHMGRTFLTIVRPVDGLQKLLASDPYADFRLKPGSKRIVTFLRGKPRVKVTYPVTLGSARILCRRGSEVFSAYVRDDARGPDFMVLIESTFGKEITTRTWDTVEKITTS
jgi:uncharacterized protein (DUF1697 family)